MCIIILVRRNQPNKISVGTVMDEFQGQKTKTSYSFSGFCLMVKEITLFYFLDTLKPLPQRMLQKVKEIIQRCTITKLGAENSFVFAILCLDSIEIV